VIRQIPDAKLTVPELPTGFVARPALRDQLDELVKVGLVCAPAGCGKTVLMADWARSASIDTAWVSLDPDDDDATRLWSAVLEAIKRCPSVPPASRFNADWEWPSAGQPEFLAELTGALASLPHPIRLILDDLHELVDAGTLHGVAMLLRNLPDQVGVLLSSRFDPSVGLHRLRLSQQLLEVRVDQLHFSRAEAKALLDACGLDLTLGQIDALHRHTDGWAAGLRLAALAMAQSSDVEDCLAHFSGNERSVADYLVGEVLSSLPPDVLDFLRRMSVSDPIPAELAAELSGREEASSILDALEHRTEMVRATGPARDAYRIQPLLRSYLLADLSRHGASRAARLHAVAARWAATDDRPGTAIEHAIQSNDSELLVDLLRRFGLRMLLAGEHRALRQAIEASGAPVVAADPTFSLLSALVHREAGELTMAERDARNACRHWPDDPSPELVVLRAAAEELGALMVRTGRRMVDTVDEVGLTEPGVEGLARLTRAAARLRSEGEANSIRQALELALAVAQRNGFDYLELQCRVLLAAAAGVDQDFREMHRVAEAALNFATPRGWRDSMWALGSSAMLAYAALLRAEPQEAERIACAALRCGEKAPYWVCFALRSMRAAAAVDLGDRQQGLTQMQRARAQLGDRPLSEVQIAAAAMLEFEAALRPGHQVAARAVQDWLAQRSGETAEYLIMRAWANAATGRHDAARNAVQQVVDGRSAPLLAQTQVDAWLQVAASADHAGERLAVRRALEAALRIAEPLDVLRPFVEADARVRTLLTQRYLNSDAGRFFGRVLAAQRRNRPSPVAALSERELTVLSMLPSLLSLEEIAADLAVSVNTVKSHVRSIYNKLGASSRRTAVLTAYENRLIASAQQG
jgi:LuxR family maltose regulon positive regulatory protein